ncbi:MAG: hypothetical protein ABL899_00250 [Nitrospira sp.]
MEINQFAEFVSAVVRQLPRDLDLVTAQRWIKDQGALSDTLRKALGGEKRTFELYLSPKQKGGWISGFDLESHLEEEKLTDRTFSLEDELVKGWLADPSTYPEEFKKKAVFLWKSQRDSGSYRSFAYLFWDGGRVGVGWDGLGSRWFGGDPVLLASS